MERLSPNNFIWFAFILLSVTPSLAQEVISLNEESAIPINQSIEVFHTTDTLTGEIAWQRITGDTMPRANSSTNAGMKHATDAYWLLARFQNTHSQEMNYYLKIAYPQLDVVNCYEVTEDSVHILYQTGDSRPFEKRPVLSRNFVLPLSFEASESKYILINLDKRKSSIRFPMTIYAEALFFKTHFNENLVNSFFFGFLILVVLASLIVGLITRKPVFLVYSFYVFAFTMWLFARLGYAYQFITGDFPEVNRHFLPMMSQLAIMALIWYVQEFFHTHKNLPRFHRVMNGVQIFFILGYVFWLSFPDVMVNFAVQLFPVRYAITFVVLLFAIISAINHLKIDRTKAWMFLGAYTLFFMAIIGKILMEYALVDDSDSIIDPIVVGFVVEIAVLSTAMAIQLQKLLNPQPVPESTNEIASTLGRQNLTLKSKAVLSFDRIIYIQSAGHYLEFHMVGRKNPEVDRNRLKDILKDLPDHFVQTHRSHVVNTDFVKIKYANKLILDTGDEIPISRTFKKNLD